ALVSRRGLVHRLGIDPLYLVRGRRTIDTNPDTALPSRNVLNRPIEGDCSCNAIGLRVDAYQRVIPRHGPYRSRADRHVVASAPCLASGEARKIDPCYHP